MQLSSDPVSATYSINQTRQKSLEVAKGKEEISQPYTITRWVIKMSEQLNQQVLSMSYRICQPSNDTRLVKKLWTTWAQKTFCIL